MSVFSPDTKCSSYTAVISARSVPCYSACTTKLRSDGLTVGKLKGLARQSVESTLQVS